MKKALIPSILVLMVSSYFLYQYLKKEEFQLNQMVSEEPETSPSSENNSNEDSSHTQNIDSEDPNQEEETELSKANSEESDSPFPTISIKKKKPAEEDEEESEDEEEDSTGLMQGISHKEINKAVKKFKDIDPELGKEVEEHVNAPEDDDLDLEDY